jgi:hypothetical protein
MEGDLPSALLMLAEYRYIADYLKKKLESISEPEFHQMINKMLSKIADYVSEALQCDAILLATVLNPSYQLLMLQRWYSSHASHTKTLLQLLYIERKTMFDSQVVKAKKPPVKNTSARSDQIVEDVDFFPDSTEGLSESELALYLEGKYKLPSNQAVH